MSLLNVNLGILAYADPISSNQPNVRLADLKWSLLGMPTDNFRNIPISLSPGETLTVASNARAISFDGNTSFQVTKVGSDRMRITAPLGARVPRLSGDSATTWSIQKLGNVVRLSATGSNAPTFSDVQIGDLVRTTGFSAFNAGEFTILSKGVGHVDYVNAYAVDQAGVTNSPVQIYSSGPVQKGDILDLSSMQFAFPNQGSFPVVDLTDSYIEVVNPNAFAQTVTGVTTGLAIYPYAYKWLGIVVDRRVQVGLNGTAPGAIEVEPAVEGDLNKSPGLFLKRGKVFEVTIRNVGLQQAHGFLLLAE